MTYNMNLYYVMCLKKEITFVLSVHSRRIVKCSHLSGIEVYVEIYMYIVINYRVIKTGN